MSLTIPLNSTGRLQAVTSYAEVTTTMNSVSFTLLDPNLQVAAGPLAPTQASEGVYYYDIQPGQLNRPGLWTAVWAVTYSSQALQSAEVITVPELY